MRILSRRTFVLAALLSLGGVWSRAQEPIEITNWAEKKTIPISISGLTGEAAATVRFDLEVMGCEVVDAERAQFLVSGSSGASLVGRLTDRLSKASMISQQYEGAPIRTLSHTFANDVIEKITGKKGIALGRIAFKQDSGKISEICVADFDGYNAKALTADGTITAAPSWGPGRRMLYYTSYRLDNADIYSQVVASGERKIVARYPGSNMSPSASPDGNHVAMILSKAGMVDLYVSAADGSNLRRLTTSRDDESSPCWSPDGQTICFVSKAGGRAALYRINVNGGEPRRIQTAGVGGTLTEPDWSPDGKTIVFTSQTAGFDICVVPAEGGVATVLTSGEDPSWAPNSRTVVFARRAGGRRVLSLLDVPTKRVKDVARISGSSCSQPCWAKY